MDEKMNMRERRGGTTSEMGSLPDTKEGRHGAPDSAATRREIAPLVVADLEARIAVGVETYGAPLAVESPNDALLDAYEEALDLCLYLKQELMRRET